MRIVCPSCSAAYDVPDSLMTAGRQVRCARCGSDWVPLPATPAASPELEAPLEADPPAPPAPPGAAPPLPGAGARPSVATVRPSAMARLAAHPAMPRSSTRLWLAWAGSIVLLILLFAVAFAWRSQIVAAWPPSARAYAAFGLHPQTGPSQ
jgi:predicted Zn finger-like uncharacterized protein